MGCAEAFEYGFRQLIWAEVRRERASTGVRIEPGLTELARMLSAAWSSASARVRLWIAPFDAA
jgi:hypothetical protein